MAVARVAVLVAALAACAVRADVFLQNPAGSLNRQSSQSQTIDTPNRLFDARNGGSWYYYAMTANDGQWMRAAGRTGNVLDGGYNSPGRAGRMYYYTGSVLPVEWTLTNGCGNDGNWESSSHCDVVLQYMCHDWVRDGTDGQAPNPDARPTDATHFNFKATDTYDFKFGMHETYEYYDMCRKRDRYPLLFQGDLDFATQTKATSTRQNPGAQRFGFECAEERDYYPYWGASPWRDIAVYTDRDKRCDMVTAQSQNVMPRGYCMGNTMATVASQCPNWVSVPAWNTLSPDDGAPACLPAPWLQENMVSNRKDGWPMSHQWTVPNLPNANCVLRVRYNITVGDFDRTDGAEVTLGPMQAAASPIRQDQTVPCAWSDNGATPVANCTLFTSAVTMPSTTYQDRSHTFTIMPRPASVKNKIWNLNVRGKRGNIVQTFPATEYDFVPQVLTCQVGEWIHTQWTGSDNNRANVDGEGLDKTDRSNMVQIVDKKYNYPIPWVSQTLFTTDGPVNEAIRMAYNDLARRESLCKLVRELDVNVNTRAQDVRNCMVLNPSTPYFDGGLQPCHKQGTYHYMSTRNNNFSNRSQKGTIIMVPCTNLIDCGNRDARPSLSGDFDPYQPEGNTASSAAVASLAALVAALIAFLAV